VTSARRLFVALACLSATGPGGAVAAPGAGDRSESERIDRPARLPAAHPLHLSTAQLVVEETTLYLRIRVFKDDLEGALAARAGVERFDLSPTPESDAAFLAYLGTTLSIQADGAELSAAVISSGVDLEAGQGDATVWWYLLSYESPAPVRSIAILDAVLFERFDDQRNIVRVLHSASGKQRTLYFAAPDDDPITVSFD